MTLRHPRVTRVLAWLVIVAAVVTANAQDAAETFTATGTTKTKTDVTATAPVTIVISRKMSRTEADGFIAAFKNGGVAGLRKALEGVPPTGSIRLGTGAATPTRLTLERPTDKGRLLTIVIDQPIAFVGTGLTGPETYDTTGYELAVIDIEVDAEGRGSGLISPAAKVTVKQGVFVVDDYVAALVRLTDVTKVK